MITQNSYNLHKRKKKEKKRKTGLHFLNKLVFSFILSVSSFILYSQEKNVPQKDISEEAGLRFQEYFFKALTEKAIFNHQRAIENLEECNQLIPNNKSVLFELSKNYAKLNKYPEAIDYGNQALRLDSQNLWILQHLVKVHSKTYDFEKAVSLQEKIALKYPKKKQKLVYLHLQNNNKTAAKKVLNELATAKMLNSRLQKIKASLERKKQPKVAVKKPNTPKNENLKLSFEKDKSFTLLEKLLTDLDTKNDTELLKYSEQGISLFPAQPLVYLMNGKALNKQKKHKDAIDSLQNGIDFVIDNTQLEVAFYTQLVKAYEALGDTKNVRKYRKKLKS